MSVKFLVVDDSQTMRRIVINALKVIGFDTVVEAGDGKEALQKLQEENPNFVITDWNMPEMNGLDLVKAIRSTDAYGMLPVLMVTTRGNKTDVIEAMQAKANNYIIKPFTPQALKEKIDQILKAA
ncbi:MAG: response regulator [Bacteroidetes bacterium]|nr:response regulator [Bacteroidota bacterium]